MAQFKPKLPKAKVNSKPITLHLDDDQRERLKVILEHMKPLKQQELLRQMVEHCMVQLEKTIKRKETIVETLDTSSEEMTIIQTQ